MPDSILTHIFNAANFYASEVEEYKAELYLKGLLKIHKRNRIIKYIPSMFRLEKGVNSYIHESISKLHYTAPSIYDRKVQSISSTFPGSESRFFDIADFLKFNLYAPSIMEDKVLSPLSKESSIHYNYLLDSVAYRRNGKSTSCVSSHAIPVPSYWKGRAGFLPVTGPSATSIFKGNMT